MTEITITANGKPCYHYVINRVLSEKEIAEHIDQESYPIPGVEYHVTVKIA